MARRYKIFDVFTDRPLAGNPLAVVLDAAGLDDAAMQAVAREFNLSETIFVLPAASPAHSAAIRIFTPAKELPFAGHPIVGAALCLARERFGGSGEHDAVIVLEGRVGPIRCGVKLSGKLGSARRRRKRPSAPRLGWPRPTSASRIISRALGLAAIRSTSCRCATWPRLPRLR